MDKMTSNERFKRILEHKEADRVPIWDFPWPTTISRWHDEGFPQNADFADYFGLDKVARIVVDNSPQYEERIVEETDEYKIYTTQWGGVQKDFKHKYSTPEFISYSIINPEKWKEAKKRMIPTPDRIPWDDLKKNYKKWRDEGYWIDTRITFGFDACHILLVGTERFLMVLLEDPDWCVEMFNHFLDVNLALLEKMIDSGYKFDSITWTDDLGYKNGLFISRDMYRELLKPVQKRAVDWAHNRGLKVRYHTDGNINEILPDLIDIGIDLLHPLEVKAGMNPVEVKEKYGDKLAFHGGLNAMLWNDIDAITAEMKKVVPVLKKSGGYVLAADHSIPDDVSFTNIKAIIELAKKLGSY